MDVVERAELVATRRLRFIVDIAANALPKFLGRAATTTEEWAKALASAFSNASLSAIPDMAKLVFARPHNCGVFVRRRCCAAVLRQRLGRHFVGGLTRA
uniref:Uncharacterized protein n=1 Tax=Globodera rostochiensis TaxID=31243 RepID=A0A914HL52_GLORO